MIRLGQLVAFLRGMEDPTASGAPTPTADAVERAAERERLLEEATTRVLAMNAPRPDGLGLTLTHFMARKIAKAALGR